MTMYELWIILSWECKNKRLGFKLALYTTFKNKCFGGPDNGATFNLTSMNDDAQQHWKWQCMNIFRECKKQLARF